MKKRIQQDPHSRSIRRALVALILDKPYEQIRLGDILRSAPVSSYTFYAQYWDKDDLVLSSLDNLMDDVARQLPTASLLEADETLYRALSWEWGALPPSGAVGEFPRFVLDRKPDLPLQVLANHVAGQVQRLGRWCLDNHLNPSPTQMKDIFRRIMLPDIQDIQRSHWRDLAAPPYVTLVDPADTTQRQLLYVPGYPAFDGCIAQGDTEVEAVAGLDDNQPMPDPGMVGQTRIGLSTPPANPIYHGQHKQSIKEEAIWK